MKFINDLKLKREIKKNYKIADELRKDIESTFNEYFLYTNNYGMDEDEKYYIVGLYASHNHIANFTLTDEYRNYEAFLKLEKSISYSEKLCKMTLPNLSQSKLEYSKLVVDKNKQLLIMPKEVVIKLLKSSYLLIRLNDIFKILNFSEQNDKSKFDEEIEKILEEIIILSEEVENITNNYSTKIFNVLCKQKDSSLVELNAKDLDNKFPNRLRIQI